MGLEGNAAPSAGGGQGAGAGQDTGGARPLAAGRLLIDGKLTETGRTFPSLNPATGEVFGHAPDATAADAEAARRATPQTASGARRGGEASGATTSWNPSRDIARGSRGATPPAGGPVLGPVPL